ncbi:hypothetical protein CMV_020635 [Castanea mollissima]|uniref:Uncharacterized protein n=1 Tax=Castanea mollissima TaxID=60419 RepID=A0A8J4QHB1_9ROSI|nr:hypothetical protein CMV_020635 [Castanea mollissima]
MSAIEFGFATLSRVPGYHEFVYPISLLHFRLSQLLKPFPCNHREWSRQIFVFMIESTCVGYMEEDVLDGMPSLDSSGDGLVCQVCKTIQRFAKLTRLLLIRPHLKLYLATCLDLLQLLSVNTNKIGQEESFLSFWPGHFQGHTYDIVSAFQVLCFQ